MTLKDYAEYRNSAHNDECRGVDESHFWPPIDSLKYKLGCSSYSFFLILWQCIYILIKLKLFPAKISNLKLFIGQVNPSLEHDKILLTLWGIYFYKQRYFYIIIINYPII